MGVLLAQELVLPGEESLTLEAGAAYRTHKAGVVPCEAQGLQEFVPCLDRKITAMAAGPKQVVIVCVCVNVCVCGEGGWSGILNAVSGALNKHNTLHNFTCFFLYMAVTSLLMLTLLCV